MKFKKISNIILLTVIFFVLATQSFSIIVFANYTYDFENMTEKESLDFVVEHNIDIPIKLQAWDGLGDFTRRIILTSYNNPDLSFSIVTIC